MKRTFASASQLAVASSSSAGTEEVVGVSSNEGTRANDDCLQLPAFLLFVAVPGKTQKAVLLLSSPSSMYDPAHGPGKQVTARDATLPDDIPRTRPLFTHGANDALLLHFARYAKAEGVTESVMWALAEPYVFRAGMLIEVDFNVPQSGVAPLLSFHDYPYGPVIIGNVQVKPAAFALKNGPNAGQVVHKFGIYATHLKRTTPGKPRGLETELMAVSSLPRQLLPPLFSSPIPESPEAAAFAKRQAERRDEAVLARCVTVASQHYKYARSEDVRFRAIQRVPLPSPTTLVVAVNREFSSALRSKQVAALAFDSTRFVIPEPSITATRATAGLQLAVLNAPLPGELLHWHEDAGRCRMELQMNLLLVGMQVPPPAVDSHRRMAHAANYEVEKFMLGFSYDDGNKIYSNTFARFGQPYPFLVAPLLANPTPAFGRVPLLMILDLDANKARGHTRNSPMNSAERDANFPNGFFAPHVEAIIPEVVPYLCYKGIPVSLDLLFARYADFAPSYMAEEDMNTWALGAYGSGYKNGPRTLDPTYRITRHGSHPGFIWLDTLSDRPLRTLKQEFEKARDQWCFYAVPAYNMGAQCPPFAPDPAIAPLVSTPEQCPHRHAIRDPVEGDALVRRAAAAAYAARAMEASALAEKAKPEDVPTDKIDEALAMKARNPPMDAPGDLFWRETDIWMQAKIMPEMRPAPPPTPPRPIGVSYTPPLFLFFAVPKRSVIVYPTTPPADADEDDVDAEVAVEPPAKKPRLDDVKEDGAAAADDVDVAD